MNNMGVDWLMNILSLAQDTISVYVVTPFLFASMGAIAIISLVLRNLKIRFFPLLRGYSAFQFENERPELLGDAALAPDAFDNAFFRSSKEILQRKYDSSDRMKDDHTDLPF